MLATLNLLDEKDFEGSDAENQKNAFGWELSISEEKLAEQ